MSDERPKKSWREIDAQRDRSGGRTRRDPGERERQQAAKTAAYSKYKGQLDKLFTPGGAALPESLRAKLGPASPEAEARKKALDALRASPNAETLAACLEGNVPLPEEPRLLLSLLDVQDEVLLPPVLSALLALVKSGKKPNRMLLAQKLGALANRTEDSEIAALADRIREALE